MKSSLDRYSVFEREPGWFIVWDHLRSEVVEGFSELHDAVALAEHRTAHGDRGRLIWTNSNGFESNI